MRIGFFSPLPPASTGVADYSAALLSELRKHGDVVVNAPDCDIALYHVGNNHLHREIYQRALAHPGVVVLHDASLNHFFLGALDEAAYVEEFVFNYGEWTRGLAQDLWTNRARSAADPRYFEYPMLKRLVTASRAIIVHNPAALRIVRAHDPIPSVRVPLHDCRGSESAVDAAPTRGGRGVGGSGVDGRGVGGGRVGGGRVGGGGVGGGGADAAPSRDSHGAVLKAREAVEIPHLFVPPALPSAIDTLRLRAELGLGPRTLLAGVFGHLRESKRLHAILRTMDRLWDSGVDIKLLVQGAFASSDLERAISPLLKNHPRILRQGHLSEPDFWRYAAATDVCLNLRFPTAGETSGIAIRMMGIGKTVVFNTGDETSRFPDGSCLRVDHGPAEEAMLADYLRWLASSPEAAREIGRRAAAHISRDHALDRVASQYWEVLSKSREADPRCPPASLASESPTAED